MKKPMNTQAAKPTTARKPITPWISGTGLATRSAALLQQLRREASPPPHRST